MRVSVITPSVRPEMLKIVQRCLARQTFKDFEWIVVGSSSPDTKEHVFLSDPKKREGDYYRLNGAYNKAFRESGGELIISIQDGLWFPPNLLESFWNHYQANPSAIVGAIGHQYDRMENGKPEHMVWRDPRSRLDYGSFYEVGPNEIEYTVASIPRKAIFDVGGIDEEFDKFAALSEKEMNFRMDKLGYKFFLDQLLEYRAISHPRLSEEWDRRYDLGCTYFQQCLEEISTGKRLKLDALSS